MGEQDERLTGADLLARNADEWAKIEAMVYLFNSSGELPPGLVYNLEPDEAGWHLGLSADFPGNHDEQLVFLARFWGSIGKSGRRKVEEAKRKAVTEAEKEGEAAIEARAREILRDRIKLDNARGGAIHPRVFQHPSPRKSQM